MNVYAQEVLKFHAWFMAEQDAFHKNELDDLHALRDQLREAFRAAGILEEGKD